MKYDIDIKVKSSVIESLFPYDKRLNKYHEKPKIIRDKATCQGMIENILKPILAEIKVKERKQRDEHHWNYADTETMWAKKSCQELIKMFKAIKSALISCPNWTVRLTFK